jgi:hypothetical protein
MQDASDAYGPYAFTLEPHEIDAVAARHGLRSALGGGLTASHHAPLAAFALTLLFAAILAKTELISRRAGEIVFLLAALAFMTQRLLSHRRIWRARTLGRVEVERMLAGRPMTMTIGDAAVSESGGGSPRRLPFADCRDAEESGGLVYVWGRDGAPFVLPGRVLADGEAAKIVTWVRDRIRGA